MYELEKSKNCKIYQHYPLPDIHLTTLSSDHQYALTILDLHHTLYNLTEHKQQFKKETPQVHCYTHHPSQGSAAMACKPDLALLMTASGSQVSFSRRFLAINNSSVCHWWDQDMWLSTDENTLLPVLFQWVYTVTMGKLLLISHEYSPCSVVFC